MDLTAERRKSYQMSERVRAKVSLSIAAYQHSRLEQIDTEAVSIHDAERNVVLEITPYPSHGIAQVVTMTPNQSRKIAEYSRSQSKILKEIGGAELLLDITYVPERNWDRRTPVEIPAGSAVFPVLDAKTVPIESVKPYL